MASLSCARCVTSSVRTKVAASTSQLAAPFSTSTAVAISRRRLAARKVKDANLERRELTERLLEQTKPDPILGVQQNETGDAIWANSELAKIVLTKEQAWGLTRGKQGTLRALTPDQQDVSGPSIQSAQDAKQYGGPDLLNFGLQASDRELLFKGLPQVMIKDRVLDSTNLGILVRGATSAEDLTSLEQEYERVQTEEEESKEALSRMLDLKNASGKGIQVENIRRIVEHFGGGKDTGSSETQAAVLTYRIRNLQSHLLDSHRRDNSNRRAMGILVHQRAKILKYLKRTQPARYHALLPRIGIEARAVEGEIVIPGRPRLNAK